MLNKKYIIIIFTFILITTILYIKIGDNDISINEITKNYNEEIELENLDLSFIYGNTSSKNYTSYKYKNKDFVKENKTFLISVNGVIDKEVLELIFNENNYENIIKEIGQVSFYKIIDNNLYIVFDGKYKDNNKENIIYKISLSNGKKEKIVFNTDYSFFSVNIYEYDNKIFIAGLEEKLDKNNNSIGNVIIYKLSNKNIEKIKVLETNNLIQTDSYKFVNGHFLFSEWSNNYEYIYSYNIDKNKIVNKIKTPEISSYQDYENYILLFSKDKNNLNITFNDINLNKKEEIKFDIGNYSSINKVFVNDDKLYILIEKDKNNHILYKYENKNIIKLLDFSLSNNTNDIFLYDIYFNNIN